MFHVVIPPFPVTARRWLPRHLICVVGSFAAVTVGVVGTGCDRGPRIVPVRGIVRFNGKPLAYGSVMFQPSQGQPAVGEIKPDGTFVLSTFRPEDGAVVGPHLVRVACYESQQSPRAAGGEIPLGRLMIPEKYTHFELSGLTAEVKDGDNPPFEFNLMGR